MSRDRVKDLLASPEAMADFKSYNESPWWKTQEGIECLNQIYGKVEQIYMGPELKVKRLTDTAKLPTKAHDTDAGFDLYADISKEIQAPSDCMLRIPVGISISIPDGYCGLIKDRSSYGVKGDHIYAGVIDSSYRGGLVVVMHSTYGRKISPGDKIAQLLIVPVPKVEIVEVDELDDTERGSNGFGSTGT